MAEHFIARGELPFAKWALLHDAAEAYVGDIIRPLKPYLPGFADIEAKIERCIAERFNLVGEKPPAPVKEADQKIRIDEMNCLFPAEAVRRVGIQHQAALGLQIRALFPTYARDLFMRRFRELFP